MAKPVNGPIAPPRTAINTPINNGASGPRGTPFPSSVNAIINAIRIAVITNSTAKAPPILKLG